MNGISLQSIVAMIAGAGEPCVVCPSGTYSSTSGGTGGQASLPLAMISNPVAMGLIQGSLIVLPTSC